jgi:hypothetical protein
MAEVEVTLTGSLEIDDIVTAVKEDWDVAEDVCQSYQFDSAVEALIDNTGLARDFSDLEDRVDNLEKQLSSIVKALLEGTQFGKDIAVDIAHKAVKEYKASLVTPPTV